MNWYVFPKTIVALLFVSLISPAGENPKGHLVIIGGGKRGQQIMQTYVQLAGGEGAKVVVFPMASELADTIGPEQAVSIQQAGARTVFSLNINHAQAESDSIIKLLDGVTGVFFSGGDQSKLTAALLGTQVEKKLHQLYQDGAVLGGTSAGAAVMSKMMITGREKLSRDTNNAYTFIKRNNIETAEGFGFLDNAIVDQHFIKRKRHNRLISLVLENPRLIGIGIDEATAIVVNPDESFSIVGEGTVMVFDAAHSKKIRENEKGHLGADNILLHILMAGDSFNMKTRTVHSGQKK
jgi:cyanophycinase